MKHLAKRTLSLLLAAILVLSLIPAHPIHVHAEDIEVANRIFKVGQVAGVDLTDGTEAKTSGVTIPTKPTPNSTYLIYPVKPAVGEIRLKFGENAQYICGTAKVVIECHNSYAHTTFTLSYGGQSGEVTVNGTAGILTKGDVTSTLTFYVEKATFNVNDEYGLKITNNHESKYLGIRSIKIYQLTERIKPTSNVAAYKTAYYDQEDVPEIIITNPAKAAAKEVTVSATVTKNDEPAILNGNPLTNYSLGTKTLQPTGTWTVLTVNQLKQVVYEEGNYTISISATWREADNPNTYYTTVFSEITFTRSSTFTHSLDENLIYTVQKTDPDHAPAKFEYSIGDNATRYEFYPTFEENMAEYNLMDDILTRDIYQEYGHGPHTVSVFPSADGIDRVTARRSNVTVHGGGTANCQDKAICAICGVSYGQTDPNIHIFDENGQCACGLEKVESVYYDGNDNTAHGLEMSNYSDAGTGYNENKGAYQLNAGNKFAEFQLAESEKNGFLSDFANKAVVEIEVLASSSQTIDLQYAATGGENKQISVSAAFVMRNDSGNYVIVYELKDADFRTEGSIIIIANTGSAAAYIRKVTISKNPDETAPEFVTKAEDYNEYYCSVQPPKIELRNDGTRDKVVYIYATVLDGETPITAGVQLDNYLLKDGATLTAGGTLELIPEKYFSNYMKNPGSEYTIQLTGSWNYKNEPDEAHKIEFEMTFTRAHDLTHNEGREPTCNMPGVREHWYCSVCQKYYADADCTQSGTQEDTVLPATGHNYGNDSRNGQCTLCQQQTRFGLYGSNIDLGNTMDFNFYFIPTEEAQQTDAEGYFAVITRNNAQIEVPRTDWEAISGNYYKITLAGLPAKELVDEMTITIYKNDIENPVSATIEESALLYTKRVLSSTDQPDEAKKMVVDMLKYAEAAQIYFKYKQETPSAYSQLTEKEKACGTSNEANGQANASVTVADGLSKSLYIGTNFDLEKNISMNMYVAYDAENPITKAEISLTDHLGHPVTITITEATTEITYYDHTGEPVVIANAEGASAYVKGKYYLFKISDGFVTADCSSLEGRNSGEVTAKFYRGEEQTPFMTVKDSMDAYVKRGASQYPWLKTVLTFANSAYAYLHRPTNA